MMRTASTFVAGIAVFVAGVWAAAVRLPEWRAAAIPARVLFSAQLDLAARRAQIVTTGEPRFSISSESTIDDSLRLSRRDPTYDALGPAAPAWLTANGRGPYVLASIETRAFGRSRDPGRLLVLFSLRGKPVAANWTSHRAFAGTGSAQTFNPRAMAEILAPPPELGRMETATVLGQQISLIEVRGSRPAEHIAAANLPGSNVTNYTTRLIGDVDTARKRMESLDIETLLRQQLANVLISIVLFVCGGLLFIVLLVRRRIDMRMALVLAVLSLLFSLGAPMSGARTWLLWIDAISDVLGKVVAIFVLWAGTESWIRASSPGYRTTLDVIRTGRIGPAAGKALLSGWAVGAAIGGVWLMGMAGATYFWGVSLLDASVHVPLFDRAGSPVGEGALRAGFLLLAIGASRQIRVLRRIPLLSTLLGALFLSIRFPVSPLWPAMAIGLVIAGLLVFAHERFGLAAFLTASIVALSLPAAVYGARHFEWLGSSSLLAAAVTAAPLVAAAIGLARRGTVEDVPIQMPAFARRIEQERRIQYEMDLLARMQIGLLPQTTPAIEGYEVAAKSLLATEAGGDLYDFLIDERKQVWIAAGDVSGHGFSCAIAQAMTKAGLSSLIHADQTPAAVLTQLDQVLRRSGSLRTFTTLALLRLDPARAECLLSNAGHPYALHVNDGGVDELAMPSLPLGQGPAREYRDEQVTLDPGAALVFCSDGLFEAMGTGGALYGYDRIKTLLSEARDDSAEQILNRILDDWRGHLSGVPSDDDTTVVVLRRLA